MSITKESIIDALEKKGYKCQSNDVVKNSVLLPAINLLTESNISPCIYLDGLIAKYDYLDDIVSEIISIFEKHKEFDFDVLSMVTDKDWLLEHLFIALQRESTEPLIKKLCDDCFSGLEQYLYIRDKNGDDGWSIKLNTFILSLTNTSEDEAWINAQQNTFSPNEPVLKSLSSVFCEITGCTDFEEIPGIPQLYVLSNKCKTRGSIQVLNKKLMTSFVSSLEETLGKRPVKFVVLPSSLHEVILYPIFESDLFDDNEEKSLTELVQTVNREEVDPIDVLSDKIFILTV